MFLSPYLYYLDLRETLSQITMVKISSIFITTLAAISPVVQGSRNSSKFQYGIPLVSRFTSDYSYHGQDSTFLSYYSSCYQPCSPGCC
ncbi:hypothetical protein E4U09_001611 [Claviceps aff. purpurea]|uniref:Uncharacterized protein n=1 Tax=Claviceps aff. purpurea TaxID=1967640 RepID=A0A9P7QGZ1_9HYPO|nr:hypothetical protein E4U09_001611 [Claviceps aff. purpurea]